ncbi:aspartate carbamoyltransferase catalytic subunit [Wenzhouxiangella sp. AB-CW3]|uniref:aspartate carbamoyltransferase catalytic subunit n=1 Tax=Wenzhouxiangella sp. AB-CW3 TaxID=2771012 RepID=UPI00168BCAF6|nr:aspartate carbamoyltransferase catalytic subunit [Wenzhouxiangella sp. AB-CW3]QOC22970.1 aspartate carbamoyltransferase catalytic subunit [Wenzhouxiangella sp. AB-CW3]
MHDQTRHLLDIDRLTDQDIEVLIDRACALAAGAGAKRLKGSVAHLFFEPSTRTRVSFELAAGRVGLQPVNVEMAQASTTKGESLEDTVATLAAMGVNCMVLRHAEAGLHARLAATLPSGVHLVNAGEGSRAHPTQALLDAATLRARGVDLKGLRLAIVGDLRHSRVVASGLRLWPRLGVDDIRLAGPADLLPDADSAPDIIHCASLAEAVRGADVIMMLRIQHERMDQSGWPDPSAYHAEWGLRTEHLDLAARNCVVMHPGPINRGVEIAAEVADGNRSLILDQVRMGVFMRMAVFEWLFGALRAG